MSVLKWQFANRPVLEPDDLLRQLDEYDIEVTPLLKRANRWTNNRGREPSIGHILMTKQHIGTLPNPQLNQHVLEISDLPNRTFKVVNLSVIDTQAVFPFAVDFITDAQTPYLVTIADARSKAHLAYVDETFNRRAFTEASVGGSEPANDTTMRAKAICSALFDPLEGLFGGPLRFHANVVDEDFLDVAFHGVNAWDALWHVLNTVGWSLRLDTTGRAEVFQWENITTPLPSPLNVDGKFLLQRPVVPRTVVVACQNRDYQWHRHPDTRSVTPGDVHRMKPVYKQDYSTTEWQPKRTTTHEEVPSVQIAAHLEGRSVVWCPTFAIRDDKGAIVNQSQLHAMMKRYARRYFDMELMRARAQGYTLAGLVGVQVSARWGSVTYRNRGTADGMTTTISSVEVDADYQPGTVFKPGPPNTLDWAPYSRFVHATINRPVNKADQNEDTGEINADSMVYINPRSGAVIGTQVNWLPERQQLAMNGTGGPIKPGKVCYCQWNYQLGKGGMWVIVAIGGTSGGGGVPGVADFADWAARCVSGRTINEAKDPSLIVVNKGGMLRLLRLAGTSIGIDFTPGPVNTVLNTQSGRQLKWSTIPRTSAVHLLHGQIQFGASSFPQSSLTDGGAHIVLPPDPGRSHKYVIAERRGPNAAKLGWFGPGVDVSPKVQRCLTNEERDEEFQRLLCRNLFPYFCEWMENCEDYGTPHGPGEDPCAPTEGEYPETEPGAPSDCVQWVFRNGLLIEHPDGRLPTNRTFPGPAIVPGFHWNPCGSTDSEGGGGIPSPGGPGGPDGPDGPDGPGGPDPDGDPGLPDPEPDDPPDIGVPPDFDPVDHCRVHPLDDPWSDPCFIKSQPPNTTPITDPNVVKPEPPKPDIPIHLNDPWDEPEVDSGYGP